MKTINFFVFLGKQEFQDRLHLLDSQNLTNQKIVAITGTNGKSTTTKLIGDMLKKSKIETFVGGNIGESLCNAFLLKKKYKVHVIELSSFQLETVKSLDSRISVITNLSGDHLDRYKGISDYVSQKKNIITSDIDFGSKINKFFLENKRILVQRGDQNAIVLKSVCIGSGAILLDSVRDYIEKNFEFNLLLLSSEFEGDASALAKFHASILKEIKRFDRPIKKPAIIVSSGEAHVKLPKNYGRGGRNSHFALALAKEIEGVPGITALVADTDGIDGFEKNAGAIISGETIKVLNKEAPSKDFLRDCDSFSAHKIASSLFYSGATGINLNDIRIAIVR